MIEVLILACLSPFFLMGLALILQGTVASFIGGVGLAGLTGFFIYYFLRDEIRRRLQLRYAASRENP